MFQNGYSPTGIPSTILIHKTPVIPVTHLPGFCVPSDAYGLFAKGLEERCRGRIGVTVVETKEWSIKENVSSIAQYMKRAMGIIRANDAEKGVLMGHSFGAFLAFLLAQMRGSLDDQRSYGAFKSYMTTLDRAHEREDYGRYIDDLASSVQYLDAKRLVLLNPLLKNNLNTTLTRIKSGGERVGSVAAAKASYYMAKMRYLVELGFSKAGQAGMPSEIAEEPPSSDFSPVQEINLVNRILPLIGNAFYSGNDVPHIPPDSDSLIIVAKKDSYCPPSSKTHPDALDNLLEQFDGKVTALDYTTGNHSSGYRQNLDILALFLSGNPRAFEARMEELAAAERVGKGNGKSKPGSEIEIIKREGAPPRLPVPWPEKMPYFGRAGIAL